MNGFWKKWGMRVAFGAVGLVGTAYTAALVPNAWTDGDAYKFPNESQLHPDDAGNQTQRLINPLWAPTAYLQGIDCLANSYNARLLNGQMSQFHEYTNISDTVKQAAYESSLSYSVHVNDSGHAILLLKAMSLPQEHDKHERAIEGTIKDTFQRDQQIPALDMLVDALLADPSINTMEAVGFAQGSEGVYHLAETRKIIGTNISDTGTNYTSDHLGRYVISIDVPGDIHFLNTTGEYKPAYEIDLSDAVDFSFVPVNASWVEKIQSYAFQFDEAQAPQGYEDQGIKLVQDMVGVSKVCHNPTMR